MSSSFANSFDHFGDDGYLAPPSLSNFDSTVSDGVFISDPGYFSSGTNAYGPVLPQPAPAEMEYDALRQWRRQNAIRLEEKEKREKEMLSQIIVQADEYKVEFHRKRQASCEIKRVTNREKEQVFVASLEKFHAEADKDYWKSIAEIIPKEVATVGKKKGKKDEEKKKSVVVVQGPKPGKPSDLSRMREVLLKLKHNTPPHLKQSRTAPNASTSAAVAATVGTVVVS